MTFHAILGAHSVMKSQTIRFHAISILLSFAGLLAAPAAELLAYFAFEEDYVDTSGKGNDAEVSQNSDELSFVDGWRGKSLNINDPDEGAN